MLINGLDIVALCMFIGGWLVYTYFAKYMAKRSPSLSSVLHLCRVNWMHELLRRDVRVVDAALLGNLERNVTFFASTSILVMAGLLTLVINMKGVFTVLSTLPLHNVVNAEALLFKLSLLLAIFMYTFFTFTWAMRQYGFASVLVGAAPSLKSGSSAEICGEFAKYSAKVIDQAGHSYNYGLRAYYFALAAICWIFSAWLFIFATVMVLLVLYRREFHSKTLRALQHCHGRLEDERV